MTDVAVVGAGSFGTALAIHVARAGHSTRLWARSSAVCENISKARKNQQYLNHEVPESVSVTTELGRALRGAQLVIVAVPSHGLRGVLEAAKPWLDPAATLVCAAKGIEIESLKLMPEVVASLFAGPTAYLSGPSFAAEVAAGLPTSVVVASDASGVAERVQGVLSVQAFRCYTSHDVIGVEVGGALKNVYAIAAGACEGMGLGQNARAAMITRGLNEMALLGVKLGANPLTFAGLAGLGDLVLTCTGDLSRNRRVGVELAHGATLQNVLGTKMVAEGVRTAQAAYRLSQRAQVEMPILQQVYRVLYEGLDVRAALSELAQRDLKPEWPPEIVHSLAKFQPQGSRGG